MFQFFKELGGKANIASSQEGGDDLEFEGYLDSITSLYKVDNNSNVELVAKGKLSMEMLDR
jgi:hypothetical protein